MSSWSDQIDAYVRAQIEPGETILSAGSVGLVRDRPADRVAVRRVGALVTDRRILFAWRLSSPPHAGEWTHEALAFAEIARWSQGRRHDERPMLRLEHRAHRRLEWVPAHRFLWFRWGNVMAEVSRAETTFSFASRRDPVFQAMRARLELHCAIQAEPFVEMVPGMREERRASSGGVMYVWAGPSGALARLGRRLAMLDHDLHHGNIHWWIRLASWALFAVPASFISPWLALPAVVLVEIAWVAGLWWSRRRQRP
ncbi:MAG: hypothetical protein M3Q23_01780 [Actinomycetota bacterium]|nr:hypothetical protein [Actinomycetota bacterium]